MALWHGLGEISRHLLQRDLPSRQTTARDLRQAFGTAATHDSTNPSDTSTASTPPLASACKVTRSALATTMCVGGWWTDVPRAKVVYMGRRVAAPSSCPRLGTQCAFRRVFLSVWPPGSLVRSLIVSGTGGRRDEVFSDG